jgi:hypothetical protein
VGRLGASAVTSCLAESAKAAHPDDLVPAKLEELGRVAGTFANCHVGAPVSSQLAGGAIATSASQSTLY